MRDITLIDPSLKSLFESKFPWSRIMVYLEQSMAKHARTLQGSDNSVLHLVLFNPINQDYLLYLRLTFEVESPLDVDTNVGYFEIFSVSRDGVRDSIEYDHINDVINSILFFLWTDKTL